MGVSHLLPFSLSPTCRDNSKDTSVPVCASDVAAGYATQLSFAVSSGVTYYFVVGTYDGTCSSDCTFQLSLSWVLR